MKSNCDKHAKTHDGTVYTDVKSVTTPQMIFGTQGDMCFAIVITCHLCILNVEKSSNTTFRKKVQGH